MEVLKSLTFSFKEKGIEMNGKKIKNVIHG